MAETTNYKLPYPSNYGVAADVPSDLKKLAEKVEQVLITLEGTINNNSGDISQINQEQKEQNSQITALKEENKKLKNQIPQGTVEGEAISIQDSSDMEFKVFNIRGNHKQATRSGYQLVDYSREPDVLTRATYNFEGDIITVASLDAETKGQAFARYIITDIIKENAGKTLKFACGSFNFANGNGANVQLAVVYNDGTSSKYITLLASSSNTTYTIPSDTSNIENVYFNIIVNNSSSTVGLYSITITKPMLYFGTDEKEYEQYGLSPSVEYPSPIQAMGENGSVNEVVNNGLETSNEKYEEQTITMPIQQPMVEVEDYIDWDNEEEVHSWAKIESYNGEEITTEYISTTGELSTGATVWYKLQTPTKLPFTEEQKATKKQIKALHTYKNVTNIYSTDEVGANVEATYYSDLDTIIESNNNVQAQTQKLQEQVDAITELLSTTGTSAMLLDNYQTDLESEVK